ncbi:MAG TPA: helix-turn-helix transcriptional regulator [Streptosporangiaceae bacterium]|nr:helix-turn-helix transcriptional regulator [Streptosporangiaceae bacterium]
MSEGSDGGLPAEAPLGSAVVRVMLGAQLRRLRERAELTPDAAGYHIRASRSKISRMETGRVGFKERDVADLLELYGVSDKQVVASMLELASQANAQDWWAKFGDVLPDWFEPYLGLEAAASLIRTFDLQFVNGLFQTEAYARSVASIGLRGAGAAEVERIVGVRVRRQELLTSAHAPRVWCIMDEAALRRTVGGVEVMRGQLRHLAEVARLPNVTLQVVPFRIGGHEAAGGSFTVLRFAEPDVPDVVYIEQLTGAMYLEKRSDVDHYLDVSNRLGATSLDPAATMRFFSEVIRDL